MQDLAPDEARNALRSALTETTWLFRREGSTHVSRGKVLLEVNGATHLKPASEAPAELRRISLGPFVVGVHEIKAATVATVANEWLARCVGTIPPHDTARGWDIARAVFPQPEYALRLTALGQVVSWWRPTYRDITDEVVSLALRTRAAHPHQDQHASLLRIA